MEGMRLLPFITTAVANRVLGIGLARPA